MALLTLAGCALRAWMLDRWIDYDEAFTYLRFASRSFEHAIGNYSFPNNHVFHTVLVWCSTRGLGLSVLSLRLPALLCGCALIPLCFLLARACAGNAAGLIAAALVAGSSLLAQYSVMARGYSVQAALFVAALLATRKLVERPSAGWALVLAALLALALFTVPTLVYGAGSVFAWGALLSVRTRSDVARRLLWLAGAGVAAAALSAWLYRPVLAFMRVNKVTWGAPYKLSGATLYHDLLDYFASFLPAGEGWLLLLLIAAGALCELRQRQLPTVLLWVGVPMAALFVHLLVARRLPFPRTFVFLMPLLCVLAGAGAQQLWSLLARARADAAARWQPAACALAATSLLLWTAAPGYAEHVALSRPAYPNTRFLFEQLVVPMRPRDELALHSRQMRPLLVYARIANIPLHMVDRGFRIERAQHVGGDRVVFPSLLFMGQRFAVLALSEAERDAVVLPPQVQARKQMGLYRWDATLYLSAAPDLAPVLWELKRRDEPTAVPATR